MPRITTDPGILAAARNAIEILLRFKGVEVAVVRRGEPIAKPGGGHDRAPSVFLAPQTFAMSQLGDDEAIDGDNGDTPILKRVYALTARHDADLQADDTWEDDEAVYRVDTVNSSNGFKVSATVVGFVKVGE
ncbi:hypothetical protein SEA_LEOPARD_14 [Mycobacterium phage Leopard]|uniref:Uncharacterized protein n=1 Tax=Mycobacterium phage Onyinye TaxID=2686235 RepID=A0A6B9LDA9_9CAUD|nr:hypothetical protein PP339_gp015 [Mycobacterium phage Onyinye]QHB37421.1 hypothetical protein SEA_ONYINYE_15 [Mycobacterium phage Onyinye]UOW92892.1 hypothetical protein SEA_LEOPARD_14 [Mycobacterium phage Leopard]WKW85176.1 hypothetical protein SEA_AIKOY__14 [Mycobacterium phage Aikoy]